MEKLKIKVIVVGYFNKYFMDNYIIVKIDWVTSKSRRKNSLTQLKVG